jgi:peptidoglycan/xylan/chitin deacetylase (PgdA/CDA1 family)
MPACSSTKRLLAALLAVAAGAIATACQREVPVLLYHAVGCGTSDPLDVPVDQFEAQLADALRSGHRFLPLSQLVAGRERGEVPDPKTLALTFDDGAACLFSEAFPVLQRLKIPFTLFLTVDWLGGDPKRRPIEKVNEHTSWPGLAWPEVRQMVASGLAEVGSHGVHHLYLPRASEAELQTEIATSRQALAEGLDTDATVDLFAYPFGAFNRYDIRRVRAAGYRAAFSVGAGTGGLFAYCRRSIHRDISMKAFEGQLDTRWILPLINHDP